MMRIKRVYNNNVVMAFHPGEKEELIVIGKGLAFQKKAGDELEEKRIEKIFTLKDKKVLNRLEKLISDIPSVYLSITEEIYQMLQKEPDLSIDENIYITLADHISLSLEREKQKIPCVNPLLMEIKQFYKREFALAQKAAEIIYRHLGIRISEAEMGFITLHIVNASMKQRSDHLIVSTQIIRDILGIVQEHFGIQLREDSLSYSRFIRHLQFFARRALESVEEQEQDEFLYILGANQYPEAFLCAGKISAYMLEHYGRRITNAEKGYLIYHIMTVITTNQ